jgi:sulfite reductase (NADPH) flavoprotein alpha-component
VKKWLFQLHWLLGITAGVVLAVVGVTGGLMSFEREIMAALSPNVVTVQVQGERLTPDAIVARFHAQRETARIEQITLWPQPARSALIRMAPAPGERRGDSVYINPYNGELLGKIRGEQFFRTVRSLHRWLLIPSAPDQINIGRQITGFSAFALVFFALSGLYLRWPRRALNWRNWFRIDFSLKGRNFYWALHSVIGTWVLVVYLLLAFTGLTWSYSWFKSGASMLLTGEPVQERRGFSPGSPGGAQGGAGARQAAGGMGNREEREGQQLRESLAPVSVDFAWIRFVTTTENKFTSASLTIPRSAHDPVLINYISPAAMNDRQRSLMSFDAATGELINDQPYRPAAAFGKRIMQGIYELHTGEWFGLPGRIINMLASLLMVLFTITGYLLYLDRRKKKSKAKAAAASIPNQQDASDFLIVYASQTGTAEQLAWHSATILNSGGKHARVKSITALDKKSLESATKILWLLSTFGEGEAPDAARGFIRKLMKSQPNLRTQQFAILGLGDQRYSDYCAFAAQVEQWLIAAGAQPLFARINVDNGDEHAIAKWQQQVAKLSGVEAVTAWAAPQYERWQLQERRLLNPGSVGAPIYLVSLTPSVPGNIHWQAGDILEIKPHNDSELPHRDYSIASLSTDGKLELVVRQSIDADGRLGLGSGWLTAVAAIGEPIKARIRSNPSFHAPATSCPMICIGAGTGIAGLRAHLHARFINGGAQISGAHGANGDLQQWLIFGERQRVQDRLFGAEWEEWMQSGFLTQCDEVYSRDGEGYVQDLLIAKQQELLEWLDGGAAIYVCGSLALGAGVEKALLEILGEGDLQRLIEANRYRRDIY